MKVIFQSMKIVSQLNKLFPKIPRSVQSTILSLAVNTDVIDIDSSISKINKVTKAEKNRYKIESDEGSGISISIKGNDFFTDTNFNFIDKDDYSKLVDFYLINDIQNITEMNRGTGAFSGVYILFFEGIEKVYVGSSVNVYKRLLEHRNDLRNDRHRNGPLQRKYKQLRNFKLKVFVIKTTDNLTPFWLETGILTFINNIGKTFNIGDNAELPKLGYRYSKESREKMSKSKLGKLHKESTRLKMSLDRKGRKLTKEHIENTIKKLRKPVSIEGVVYPSASDAARSLRMNQSSITRRVNDPKRLDCFIVGSAKDPDVISGKKKLSYIKRNERLVYSVEGELFNSINEVNERFNLWGHIAIRRFNNPKFKDWIKVVTDDDSFLVKRTSKAVVVNGKYYPSFRLAVDKEGRDRRTLFKELKNPIKHLNTYYVGSEKDPNKK